MNYSSDDKSELRMVRDFMEANDQTVRFKPVTELAEHEKMLRVSLLLEEVFELAEAMGIEVSGRPTLISKDRTIDPVETLDALSDIMYVLLGAYHTTGLACIAKQAFLDVHMSNMSKLGPDLRPVKNADGKVMKGPYYRPVDLRPLVTDAMKPTVIFDDQS